MLTRVMTWAGIAALVLAVLSRSRSDYHMAISIVVSLGALALAVRAFSVVRLLWGLVFLGLLGVFTPFASAELPPSVALTFDLAALALFAISPVILRKSRTPAVSGNGAGTGSSR